MVAKKAVLVGCNYPGTNAALKGCINDVIGMKAILEEFYGFSPNDIVVLIDTDKNYEQPTGKNIKAHLKQLVEQAQDGDVLFFHFSGHGTQIPSQDGDEADGKDEAICPTDMNVIADDDLRLILKPLEAKPNAKFTFIADCCHSGTLLDHKEVIISGPKSGAPPPPQLDMQALAGLLGAFAQPAGREMKNRALPFSDLCTQLSSLLGMNVDASNVRSSLGSAFGPDASAKIQQFMAVVNQAQGAMKMLQGGGGGAAGGGGMGGILQMLLGCLMPKPNAAAGGAQANPHYAAPPGNLAEPNLKINLPPAGAKPPASSQLREDVGILITGCQSNETSADACPSGNPDKAHGALSNAIQTVLRQHFAQSGAGAPLPYKSLVVGVRDLLTKTGFAQNPCLECSDKNADSAFVIH